MNIQLNNALREVIARVKSAGLHEVAKKDLGTDEFNAKTAAQHLGTTLLKIAAKYDAIDSGLHSLDHLAAEVPITKKAGMPEAAARMLYGTAAGGVSGAGVGATLGGITGAIDPDSTFLGGVGEGAMQGAGYGALGGLGAGALSGVSPELALLSGSLGSLGSAVGGVRGGLDTTGNREADREELAKLRKEKTGSAALMALPKAAKGSNALEALKATGQMAGAGAVGGGAVGGLTGALDPDSTFLEGAGRGALYGAGTMGGGAALGQGLAHLGKPMTGIGSILGGTAAVPVAGILGGLDTSGDRERRDEEKTGAYKFAGPPPIPAAARRAASSAEDLFAGAKGSSPFSGQVASAGPKPQAIPPQIPGQIDPNLQTLMQNMGSGTRRQIGQAFGVGAEQVTPAMYMRAAHGVKMSSVLTDQLRTIAHTA